ncbi:hypothetical protein AVEN_22358-1 [Araneus ventricosus]|uniref:Uncharacterized protein n=1 Tax=Araneus ventricosus TaxID=182803 RepID=A0A4Y2FQ23_ARAVE|nr:hypothetical protein AVEN_22358-1 [Araneus ventricosus]
MHEPSRRRYIPPLEIWPTQPHCHYYTHQRSENPLAFSAASQPHIRGVPNPDSKESLSKRFWKPCRRQGRKTLTPVLINLSSISNAENIVSVIKINLVDNKPCIARSIFQLLYEYH